MEQDIPNRTGATQTFEEGNSSKDSGRWPNDRDYAELVEAVRSDDWKTAIDFLERHPDALTATIFLNGRTVLHAAVRSELSKLDDIASIVQTLVDMISKRKLPLTIQTDAGFTVLHDAIISGNERIVDCLIRNNEELVSIRNNGVDLPVVVAMRFGHKKLARDLFSRTPDRLLLEEQGRQGCLLLTRAINNRDTDMALDLMKKCPSLALAMDPNDFASPLIALAGLTDVFESGNRLVFWKRWIYNHCIHISCASAPEQVCLNIQNGHEEETIRSVRARLRQLLNLLGCKSLYEMKMVHAQFQQLLHQMCKVIATSTTRVPDPDLFRRSSTTAMFRAVSAGNFEFVYCMGKANSELLEFAYGKRRSIFHSAVEYRQPRIFSLLYSLKKRDAALNLVDVSKNTILHMAGKLSRETPIQHITGAALQMQKEMQWFKEVESICPPFCKEHLNTHGLNPRQLFTNKHQELRKEGERWMKDTATSCTVVGALIITIMFAAAFTILGDNNQNTGFPMLAHENLFKLFIIVDSLSLFSSMISVLMFLGILTSRYEEDFLISLPRKMIIGLFTLFFSIVTMMIAFSTALLLMFHGQHRIVVPIIGLASVPIILFVLIQFHLLVDMLISTYGQGIIDKKIKPWF
ncbi:hypothetical protein I3842_07G091100 [Carya illinoinensis]|uniref:PGG domain-containing protein n=1 Tax=Carya illinoinensis TaxID=32201 RepID=A0A922EKA6_CARIL|nr:hypothetical protein I3842_07G091100 [Carya illinoinensis]